MKNRTNIWSLLRKGTALLLAGVFVFVYITQLVHHHEAHVDDVHHQCDHEHHSDDSHTCHVCDYMIHKQSHYALYFHTLEFAFFNPKTFLTVQTDLIVFETVKPDIYTSRGPPLA